MTSKVICLIMLSINYLSINPVKKLLLCTALLASFPAFAAQRPVAAKAPVVKIESNMGAAVSAAADELERNFYWAKGSPIPIFDKLAVFEFSAPTAAKLKTVFGSARPYTVTRAPAAGGMVGFDIALPAHSYADLNEQNWSWDALKMNVVTDDAGRTMTGTGSWPRLTVNVKSGDIVVNNMTMETSQRRNNDDVWLGTARADVKSIDVTGKDQPGAVKMEGLSVTSAVSENGKDYDLGSDFGIKLITVMDEKIDDLRMSMRMTKLDMISLEQLSKAIQKSSKPGGEPNLDDIAPQVKAFVKGMAVRGTAIEITEMSAGYHGHRALMKGSLAVGKTVDKDFNSATALMKKLDGRFEMRVPVALVTAIARNVTQAQATRKGETPSPEMLDSTAKSLSDMAVDKATADGYARLEDGVLVSVIEFKAGKLTVNGKAVAIPTGDKKPAAATKKPAKRRAK
ncbi:DUF945 family protein [Massilia sp. CCM 8695]|uniref:DUF945 family protein n=1 Tax=Massilia frigida TaxID=2609281 RepID=A0ABX0NII5_9BURK|nr:DUF945 family protein [Massilia frigida]